MRKIKKECFIIFFIIFSITLILSQNTNPGANSKGNGNGNNSKAENNKIKENNANPNSNKNNFINSKLEDLKINKGINSSGNSNSVNLIYLEKSNLKDFSSKLDDLQTMTNNIKKDIKVLNNNENSQFKNNYLSIKNSIDNLEFDNVNFLNKIDKEDKLLIKDQNLSIKKSISNLQQLLIDINKNLDKIKSNEELYDKTVVMEKEIKNINRQYRAIEWILFEQ